MMTNTLKNHKTFKPSNDTETSPHASISFTAHYTGEMWQKLGLSHPALATQTGRQLHRLVYPLECFAKLFFGVSMGKTLTVRHSLIDSRIEYYLSKNPDVQIVEFAAGLSPRGWRFLQKYEQLRYIEIDLADMSALKEQRAAHLPRPIPEFYSADVLEDNLDVLFNQLDTNKPLLIISEGLINYFSLPLLSQLTQKIALQTQKFKHAMWITENYPFSDKPSYNQLVKMASKSLGFLSRSNFSFYFDNPASSIDFFKTHGFSHVDIFQPSQMQQAENNAHLGDTVWVIELSHLLH